MDFPKFSPVGDAAILANFGNAIEPTINRRIRETVRYLHNLQDEALIELVPTYCSLLVQYNPLVYSYHTMVQLIMDACESSEQGESTDVVTVVEIPTCYGGTYGEDISFVAAHNHLSVDDVISIHSGTDYLVYMLGFIPGFTYLGGLDPRLETPRLSTPRTLIPAGSVGIAGNQTGTYPADSPGGWQIIGRTPLTLYDESKAKPTLVSAGEYVRYVPITEDEFIYMKRHHDQIEVNRLLCKVGELRGNN